MDAKPRTIEYYETADGKCPYKEWFDGLTDRMGQVQLDKRLARVRLGLLGEWRDVGEGVIELIFKNTGPGYRIYCGQDGVTLVIILCGGTKRSQQRDIDRAKKYWREYNS